LQAAGVTQRDGDEESGNRKVPSGLPAPRFCPATVAPGRSVGEEVIAGGLEFNL
jgi:hypothetical protein